MHDKELETAAQAAIKQAYSPYSGFRVGAALRTQDGKIFAGSNVENASFSLSICAERVALFKAVSEGHRSFTDLAIVSSSGRPTFPCGACRQVLIEFSQDLMVHSGDIYSKNILQLLPDKFGLNSIDSS